ncbi:MAG: HAMP domain-containing protein, partial [Clostridiaceae bacterium]|nr:HAMP domain-containing protein [Clostridiaceae bacterium]
MKKSIFAPLMWLSITIIIVSACIMGCVHIVLIDKYIISSKTNALLQNAERISELTASLSTNFSLQLQRFYGLNIDLIAQSTQSHIIVTDIKGNVLTFSSPAEKYIVSKNINIEEFQAVLEGENVYKIGPFDYIFGKKVFTVATPVKIQDRVHGVVFLSSPVPEMYSDRNTLFAMLAISITISSLVAFALSYLISKRIIKPIKALGNAAHDLATGDYTKRVKISNVSELAELGTAFNTMAESIENHERVRIAFIANVSHDLRTPMTTITGFIQGIIDGTIPPNQHGQYLNIVQSEALRLSNLVNTFLDISKYEENKASLNKTSFDINEMIRVVLLSSEGRIRQKEIEVSFEFDNANMFVFADENEIHRVIMNLLDNAVKFTETGGKILIRNILTENKVQTGISNTGQGISEQDKQYIWGRFYKSDKSRSTHENGYGLGLFIVKSIINQH